jgi:hypothetical protein
MHLAFSGSPVVQVTRLQVWLRLLDPTFLAQSVPGVESTEPLDSTPFRVVSGLGIGRLKIRFATEVLLPDIERCHRRSRESGSQGIYQSPDHALLDGFRPESERPASPVPEGRDPLAVTPGIEVPEDHPARVPRSTLPPRERSR